MKTNVFLWAILVLALLFNACNKEDSLIAYQEESIPETEQTETDLDAYAHLEESVQALIRSLEISLQALPANINQIELSPTGAINPNGESRLAIATGTFTSVLMVKAQDLGTSQDLATGTIAGNGMMGYTTLTIPAYQAASSATNRVVGFFYWGSTNQWELFHFETQAPNGTGGPGPGPDPDENFVIPGTNSILAKKDAKTEGLTGYDFMTFATANGISTSYNEYDVTWHYELAPGEARYQTGCNAYYEKPNGSDRGKWKAPNTWEMDGLVMYYEQTGEHPRDTHGMDFVNNSYWTTLSYGGTTGAIVFQYERPGYWIRYGNGIKKTTHRVRCVMRMP